MKHIFRSIGRGLRQSGHDARELLSNRTIELKQRAEELYGEQRSVATNRSPNLAGVRFVSQGEGWIAVRVPELGSRAITLSHAIWVPTREAAVIVAEGDPYPYGIPPERVALRALKAAIGPDDRYRHSIAEATITENRLNARLIPFSYAIPSMEFYEDISDCIFEVAPDVTSVRLFVQERAAEAALNGHQFIRPTSGPLTGPSPAI